MLETILPSFLLKIGYSIASWCNRKIARYKEFECEINPEQLAGKSDRDFLVFDLEGDKYCVNLKELDDLIEENKMESLESKNKSKVRMEGKVAVLNNSNRIQTQIQISNEDKIKLFRNMYFYEDRSDSYCEAKSLYRKICKILEKRSEVKFSIEVHPNIRKKVRKLELNNLRGHHFNFDSKIIKFHIL